MKSHHLGKHAWTTRHYVSEAKSDSKRQASSLLYAQSEKKKIQKVSWWLSEAECGVGEIGRTGFFF